MTGSRSFMDQDFMLKNNTAKHLFHDYSENLPLIDYHCHISPEEIYEDRRFNNITEVWLGGKNPDGTITGDHYKWRVMRAAGIPEELVTGNADPYERFAAFASALEMAIGNPMYHWCHLELKKYFGITTPLTSATAKEIWDKTSEMLQNDPELTVRGIIRKSNVMFIGTTDDPVNDLSWHEKIAADPTIGFMVCPSFRPDKAVNINKPEFNSYIKLLAASVGKEDLGSCSDVLDALYERVDFFKAHGARATDHGLDYVPFRKCSQEEADSIYKKARAGSTLTADETEKYQTYMLINLAKKYHKENFIMEIHYSCTRNVNEKRFDLQGPDTGYDMIAKSNCGDELSMFLSELDKTDELPKTIIFSLDHNDFNLIGTCAAAFQGNESGLKSRIQLGAAWWFLDSRDGMEEQMRSLANAGLLGCFIGMLTDSRSFLSYTRHDYFRRIMCNLIGTWVEDGEYPADEEALKKIVQGISHYNALDYFNIK